MCGVSTWMFFKSKEHEIKLKDYSNTVKNVINHVF